jgi:hypothetical protein
MTRSDPTIRSDTEPRTALAAPTGMPESDGSTLGLGG